MDEESDDKNIYITQNNFRPRNDADEELSILGDIALRDRFYVEVPEILDVQLPEICDVGTEKPMRPIVVVDNVEVKKRQESRVPENTRKQTMWCLAVWRGWIKARRLAPVVNGEEFVTVERDITEMDVDEMNFWLSKFVLEVRKTNGDCFYPSTTVCTIFAADYSVICVIMVGRR